MTHDELLEEMSSIDIGLSNGMVRANSIFAMAKALRAIVELHKPFMYEGRMGKFERCSGCSSEEEWLGEIYPCPTIEAIEKELK